uniref:Activating signal cointegrator 1 complex subunit 3 n=1 Tax=Phallusia mammillata TaxID=59560 RepID=A0A6F9D7P2_9ASCI|nr:activating signal cointegrator 1 complex subunit 3 [Phallusia mammillata]
MTFSGRELPRLTTALHEFGGISQHYEPLKNKDNVHEGLQPTWAEIQVVLRKYLKNKQSLSKFKHCIRDFIELTSLVVGDDADTNVKQTTAAFLFLKLFSIEELSPAVLHQIKSSLGAINSKSIQSIHAKTVEILQLTNPQSVDDLEFMLAQSENRKLYGDSLNLNLELPRFPTEYETDSGDEGASDLGTNILKKFQKNHYDLVNSASSNGSASTKPEPPSLSNTGILWLTREMKSHFNSNQLIEPTLAVLQSEKNNEEIQNELCELLGFDHLDLITEILSNRDSLLQDKAAKQRIPNHTNKGFPQMPRDAKPTYGCQVIVQTDSEKQLAKVIRKERKAYQKYAQNVVDREEEFDPSMLREQRVLSLAASAPLFSNPAQLSTTVERFPFVYDAQVQAQRTASFVGGVRMALPEGFTTKSNKMYEEVRLPANKGFLGEPWPLIRIRDLDDIAQLAFSGTKRLNVVQSRVFETAYKSNENLLICAPTGAGKTNVAMLTVVREIIQNVVSGVIQLDKFKIVYVAPMKALAAEMTENFGKRLSPLGVAVRELTGDMQLTKAEIASTQMLITTPEKWDVVTRKSTGDVSLARLVRLLIIDEVHLLHDERGPVLETLVARTLRQVETQQTMIRIVGLSATLPNYIDVARFLRVNPHKGLFFFDGRFRPVPLQQTFVGVKARSVMQQRMDMDEVCYEIISENLDNDNQVLVFVHARSATVKTAQSLIEIARKFSETQKFSCQMMEGYGQAEHQMQRSRNRELKELFTSGLGVHHAGMLRSDRNLVEKLFSQGLIKVLCCTATLAWGVNLPAHAVVIKGTQVYNAQQGSFVDLGILDVMQIFGRAGRPQFDTTGEGTIITTHDKLSRYLSLMTRQNPIESRFVDCMVDNLNAEITLGTVNNVEDGVKWLSYTYLFTRMRKNPLAYGIAPKVIADDPSLDKWQRDLVSTAGKKLDRAKMVRYDERTSYFHPTDLGRTASHFYIKYKSIETFNECINSTMDISAILSMISKSNEFEQIKVRDEEMNELDELVDECCVVKLKGGPEDVEGKANILLQTYISSGEVRSFSLVSDLMYIAQNAARIVRGVFEIVIKQGKTRLADRLLKLCKSVDRRFWPHNTPLRQFGSRLNRDIYRKIEDQKLTIDKMRDMAPKDIGHMLRHPNIGEKVARCIQELPYVALETSIQPITRSILRIRLAITPMFRWNNHVHGKMSEPFWMWVEDPDSEHMYHSEYIHLSKKNVVRSEPHVITFTIPLIEPRPTQYYVHVESDRWFGSSAICPISFKHLILPDRHPPHTELLDLEPLPITALNNVGYQSVYNFTHFNPIQTQIFHCLYHNTTNALIGAPTGSGKTAAAELAIFQMLNNQPGSKAVYVAPLKALVRERMKDWSKRLAPKLGLKLVELTGDIAPDMRAVARSDVIITTPEKWDGVSRSWHTRGYVRQVALLIIDEIHLLGQDRGPVLEVIVSRTNFISSQTEKPVRIVGLSTALANARDLADWLGIRQMGLFNFRPSVRPVPMEVHIEGFAGRHYCPRMATMNKPCFQAIRTHSPAKPVLIFVSSRRQTRVTALDLIAHLAGEPDPKQWMNVDEREMEELLHLVQDTNLRLTLAFGIGLHHAGLVERDRSLVEKLFAEQKIQTLIATSTLAWGVNLPAHLVIVKGTEYFDGKHGRYCDFPITDVLQMMGRAGRPQYDDKAVAVILVHDVKKAFYKKFLYEPFPVESSLLEVLSDHLNAEIVAGTIANIQEAMDYLTWTYFFRRLLMNPTYYELQDTDHESVNIFLSKLLEKAITDLRTSGCLEEVNYDDENLLEATGAGKIASFYYLNHLTMRMLEENMKPDCSVEDIIQLLSEAQEFHELPVRHNEDSVNSELAKDLPVKVDPSTYDSPHTKTLLLLYAHLCRTVLPSTDYVTDLKSVLDQAIRVLQAFVDASADRGWIVTSLRCMHVIQMVTQASWFHESSFLILPHVDKRNVHVFKDIRFGKKSVKQLPELMSVYQKQPKVVERILSQTFNSNEVKKVCDHLSRLPVVDVQLSVKGWWASNTDKEEQRQVPATFQCDIRDSSSWLTVHADQEYFLSVNLRRLNAKNNRGNDKSLSPRFPKPKLEGWFLVLADRERRELRALKRISTLKSHSCEKISFWTPKSVGRTVLTLWLVSDSYLGLDQLYDVRLDVIEADIASQMNQEVRMDMNSEIGPFT